MACIKDIIVFPEDNGKEIVMIVTAEVTVNKNEYIVVASIDPKDATVYLLKVIEERLNGQVIYELVDNEDELQVVFNAMANPT